MDTALLDDLSRMLAARDGVTCEALWARGPHDAVRDALISLAATDSPPSVPMTAARCVAHDATDATSWAAVQAWMVDPARPGIALAALDAVDTLAEVRAVALADLAVARIATDPKFASYAKPRLARSTVPAVKARLAP